MAALPPLPLLRGSHCVARSAARQPGRGRRLLSRGFQVLKHDDAPPALGADARRRGKRLARQGVLPSAQAFSARLEAALRLLPRGARLADVGCDHGYFALACVCSGGAESAVAVDVAAAPVASARRHVAQAAKRDVFGAAGKVDVRQGDGIKPLRRGDAVDTLALLGVGTDTMLQVLRQGEGGGDCEAAAVQRQLRWLVVQPPAYNAPELRSRLAAIGWVVKSEAILVENGWLQCVLHAERTAMGDAEGAGEPKLRHASDERLLGPAALRADPETAPLVRLFGRKYEEALRGQREGIVRGLQGARAGGRVDELRERLEGVERDLEVLGSELALL